MPCLSLARFEGDLFDSRDWMAGVFEGLGDFLRLFLGVLRPAQPEMVQMVQMFALKGSEWRSRLANDSWVP